MEDFDHLLCEKHLNNETLELISAGKFKENDSFQSKNDEKFDGKFDGGIFFTSKFSFLCILLKNG